jgi:hypothetical protein
VVDVMTALKHKSGAEGGDRTHSLAMSKEHMDKMLAWSEMECTDDRYEVKEPDLRKRVEVMKHLEFRAFASTAWTIWSR